MGCSVLTLVIAVVKRSFDTTSWSRPRHGQWNDFKAGIQIERRQGAECHYDLRCLSIVAITLILLLTLHAHRLVFVRLRGTEYDDDDDVDDDDDDDDDDHGMMVFSLFYL